MEKFWRDRDIRSNGSSYLFYYMALCSYANFRSSYRQIEGISYLVGPGEWICRTSELSEWFRTRFQHQALSILDYLQKQNYITYTRLGRNHLVKFSITGWKQHNTALDYNYPCLEDVVFSCKYYWILYYSYLSPQQLQNTDEIIESLRPHIPNISPRTYYRKRPEAVQVLSSILWGYTSKDCLEMLDKFFPQNR